MMRTSEFTTVQGKTSLAVNTTPGVLNAMSRVHENGPNNKYGVFVQFMSQLTEIHMVRGAPMAEFCLRSRRMPLHARGSTQTPAHCRQQRVRKSVARVGCEKNDAKNI